MSFLETKTVKNLDTDWKTTEYGDWMKSTVNTRGSYTKGCFNIKINNQSFNVKGLKEFIKDLQEVVDYLNNMESN